jgi:ABC-type lipoprotein export system ATPase subunit
MLIIENLLQLSATNALLEHRRTVVVVSHDPRWREFADRTITLCDGQIEQEEKNL